MSYTMREYEVSHLLPQLKCVSDKQMEYGRSCRFSYLQQATPVYNSLDESDKKKLILWLKDIKTNVNPRFWIRHSEGTLADDWKKDVEFHVAAAKRAGQISKKTYIPPDKNGKWKPSSKPTGWKLAISNQARLSGII